MKFLVRTTIIDWASGCLVILGVLLAGLWIQLLASDAAPRGSLDAWLDVPKSGKMRLVIVFPGSLSQRDYGQNAGEITVNAFFPVKVASLNMDVLFDSDPQVVAFLDDKRQKIQPRLSLGTRDGVVLPASIWVEHARTTAARKLKTLKMKVSLEGRDLVTQAAFTRSVGEMGIELRRDELR